MGRATVLGINRNVGRVELRFKREFEFIDLYIHLLEFLDINYYDEFYPYLDKKGNIDKKHLYEEKRDTLDWYKEDFMLEVFFGCEKIFVVFESDQEMQQKFIDKAYLKSGFTENLS